MQRAKLLFALTLAAANCAEPEEQLLRESGGSGTGGTSDGGPAGKGGGRSGTAGTGTSGASGKGGGAGAQPDGGTKDGGRAGTSGAGGVTGAGGTVGTGGTGGVVGSAGIAGSGGSSGTSGTSSGGAAGIAGGSTGGSGGAPGTGFSVQYRVEISGASGSAIGSQLWIVNNGSPSANLNDLKVRYYFTNEVTAQLIANINWANTGPISGAAMGFPTGEITLRTDRLTPAAGGADSYVEFGFNAGTKVLTPGSYVQFSWTVQNHSSQNFQQSGDYSYNGALMTQTTWDKVVLLQGQNVLWGVVPP